MLLVVEIFSEYFLLVLAEHSIPSHDVLDRSNSYFLSEEILGVIEIPYSCSLPVPVALSTPSHVVLGNSISFRQVFQYWPEDHRA